MNYLSLFSGIGGLDLGLDRAGMTCVGQVERDPFRRQVLAEHWPEVPRHDDIRSFSQWWNRQSRPTVDAVVGGSPCQPFSLAGRRGGQGDARWGWPWFRDAIEVVRPRFVVHENVPGLLNDIAAFGRILDDLSTLGFDAEWSTVSACAVGAPHMRRRVFLVAYPEGERVEFGRRVELDGIGDPQRHIRDWQAESEPRRVAYGIPDRVDRVAALGDAVVPAVGKRIGRFIVDYAAEVGP